MKLQGIDRDLEANLYREIFDIEKSVRDEVPSVFDQISIDDIDIHSYDFDAESIGKRNPHDD